VTARTLAIAIPAATAIVVACLSALAAYFAGKRERRRGLYSEAVKAAVAWREMLYRVRRREKAQERALINQSHDIQEQQTYFRAWVGSESKYMQRSYDILVAEIKKATDELISDAWDDPVRPVPGNSAPDDEHPDIGACVDSFLRDVRSHLSPWPWRKVLVVARNRKAARGG